MNDADRKILELLLAEIREIKPDSQSQPTPNQTRALGAFIDAVLANNNRTRDDLARRLNMDVELVDALCDGEIPADLISDLTVIDLARALQYEPNVLRALLGRMNKTATGTVEAESAPASAKKSQRREI